MPDHAAPADSYRAALEIRVPRGLVKAIEYRVRRTTRKSAEPHEMITVASGALVDPATPSARPEDPQIALLIDDGASVLGPGSGTLRAWTQYHWTVEVRGEPETGGGPTATWSTPSAKASIMFIPTTPPVAASITGTKVGSDFELRWIVADTLDGGQVGQYNLELYRKKPGDERTAHSCDQRRCAGCRRRARWRRHRTVSLPRPSAADRHDVQGDRSRPSRSLEPANPCRGGGVVICQHHFLLFRRKLASAIRRSVLGSRTL